MQEISFYPLTFFHEENMNVVVVTHSRLVCKVSAGNDHACQTTAYLSALANQQPLILPLVIAFRHWAQVRSPARGPPHPCSYPRNTSPNGCLLDDVSV